MSVIMTMWIRGEPERLEQYAAANQDQLQSILEVAKKHGLIAHRFYGSNGQTMVIDEWPDEQSFQSFFQEAGDRIQSVISGAGISGEPGINFWRKLDTQDEFGWDA